MDSGDLNPFDFPALITTLKGKTSRYWARQDDQSILVWLMMADMELLALYIEMLEFEYSTYSNTYKGGVAAWLLSTLPEVLPYVEDRV